ncbi:TPA: hypothetical protein OT044_001843 [Citrobacter koseri]|uniref:hypothetical protein n=1 Tax=Citrobacter TaxID=544 RepID=UPI001357B24C|nr:MULTISPECIES: hypothetical protein [Citrobacter]MBJ9171041.1 hypothetical protein [Citrobacter koseri]MCE5350958.1 hypothetical protein [Citrobacter koseri]MDM2992139.1 hypothetical protein [Citrobacter sp. CK190]MDM3025845.1 hypothetical protein [Citrobacter sp. CK194]MDT7458884.1 hypothetical protein [Citrobacter koseri]
MIVMGFKKGAGPENEFAGWRRWRVLSGLQVCGLCEHCRMATLARLIRPTGVRVV